jgi:hypothetical protein
MRTWPGPGSLSGLFARENSPGFVTSIALYVSLIVLFLVTLRVVFYRVFAIAVVMAAASPPGASKGDK